MVSNEQTLEAGWIATLQEEAKEDTPERTTTPPADEAYTRASPKLDSSQSGENRLRPAADILNRLVWDESYNSTDFIIGYEDRFEGRLEASLNSWKKESTHEDKMPQRRHRIDFTLLRRRQTISSASSSSLSPTVPVLESPISFHALASQMNVSEATLKQNNRLNRGPVKPSMFFEEKEEDDDGSVPHLARGDPKDGRSAHAAHKSSVEERPLNHTDSQFFEDAFGTRDPWMSPSARIGQDSLVVIEVKLNIRSLMVVTIQQGLCLRFGNSTLPAYSMKIFALPYLIAPITNLRSTILIQTALHEILHIVPSRGIILYLPVAEENMATNSTTMMGEIYRLERETHDREPGIFKSLSRSLSRRKKSSSGVSAPLSVATTSSWAAKSDESVKPDLTSQSEGTNAGEGSNARTGRSSRTLRFFRHIRTAALYHHTTMEAVSSPSKITEVEGDLFDAPDGAALIHACNCYGSWGKGIAMAFKTKYPAAFAVYESHCHQYSMKSPQYLDTSEATTSASQITRRIRFPEGSTLIISPQKRDYEMPGGKRHWIICLFTSRGFGQRVSSVETILENTELAIADMKRQIDELQSREFGPEYTAITELRSCRFNSGLFGVDWALTREILEESGLEVTVVRPPGE
ncbi:hypothetical protein BDW59DRAFT_173891 [Aspergillus cavernicola]|uniref:MJ1316 RNA cyclic group end recognition domain-containing protein n=1 Tax=Aspergillus cavernicola TaxID=176166 RepID=A0ABR4I3P6_9EURO